MATYQVIIRACVTKTITVTADNQEDAYEAACDKFTLNYDGNPEHHEQDVLDVSQIEGDG